MKPFFLLLGLLATASLLMAQPNTDKPITVATSEAFEQENKTTYFSHFVHDGSGQLLLFKQSYANKKAEVPAIVVERFDAVLKRTSVVTLPPVQFEGNALDFYIPLQLKGKIHVLWSDYDKKQKLHRLFSSLLTPDGKITSLRLLSTLPSKSADFGYFQVVTSASRNKMLLCRYTPQKDEEQKKVSLEVYNENLVSLWSRELDMIAVPHKTRLEEFLLDEAGSVYVRLSEDLDIKRRDDGSVRQELRIYSNATGAAKILPLATPGYVIKDAVYGWNGEQELCMGGTLVGIEQKKDLFYTSAGTVGTYFLRIDLAGGKVVQRCTDEFTEACKAFFGAKKKDLNERIAIYPLNLHSMQKTANGQFTLVLLDYSEDSYEGGNKMHTSYKSGSLVLRRYGTKCGPPDELMIHRGISASDDATGLAVLIFPAGDNLHFLYNDYPKNWNKKIEKLGDLFFGEAPESSVNGANKEANTIVTTLFPDGKTRHQKLYNSDTDKIYLNTNMIARPNERDVVSFIGWKETYKLLKLSF